jgi:hypothetical protein
MPMVIDHAVSSDVQSTAGSLCSVSPRTSDRLDCPHVAPPSVEKNCGCADATRSFEAATILLVS